jgi:O-antigen/teichoic acid export membrane protein
MSNDVSLKQRLFRGGLALSSLSVVSSGLSLLVGLTLARQLGPENYGYYAFAGSVVALLAIPAQFGLPRLLSREVASLLARGEYGVLRGLEQWSLRIAILVPILIVIFLGSAILLLAENVPALDPSVFAIALVALPVLGFVSRDQGCLSGLRTVVHADWPMSVLRPAIFLLSLGVIVFLSIDVTPGLAMWTHVSALLVAAIVVRLLLVRHWPASSLPRIGQTQSRRWMKSLLPFGLLSAVNLINAKTDVLMLGSLTSAEAVGIYSIAVQGGLLVSFALTAFNGVLAPNVAHLHAVGDSSSLQRVLNNSTAILLVVSLITTMLLFVFGKDLIVFLFGDAYLPAYLPLLILAAGQLVNVSFGSVGQFLTMTGNERDALQSLCISAVLNILLNALLIPRYGEIGAAIATSASVLAWNILLSIRLFRRLGLTPGPIPWAWASKSRQEKGPNAPKNISKEVVASDP